MKTESTSGLLRLESFLQRSAEQFPRRTAVIHPGEKECSYEELHGLSRVLFEILKEKGIRPGDRVGICMQKSVGTVAAIFAVLMSRSAYVPVDPAAPVSRAASILRNCGVSAVIVDHHLAGILTKALEEDHHSCVVVVHSQGRVEAVGVGNRARDDVTQDDSIAYILHTSGSTGEPKGVVLSHRNAISFVDWCTEIIQPTEEDRFASHSPIHFDLSILDIFLAIKHGASIVLLNSGAPKQLAREIAEERVTIWYATPTVLQTMMSFGKMERYDFAQLRMILFAGEVFPLVRLRALKDQIPHPRYLNLYGPTETNVCTYYEIPDKIPPEQSEPVPIGKPCAHMECRVMNKEGVDVGPGQTGELLIHGEGVMVGYWNREEETRSVFLLDESGKKWYRTGDLVRADEQGVLHFCGRNDRMVKRRGYRIELGEIEQCLSRHEPIERAAVIALPDTAGVRIIAFCSMRHDRTLSPLRVRKFVAENLPLWMMPDRFVALPEIPQTSTLKIDYKRLEELVSL